MARPKNEKKKKNKETCIGLKKGSPRLFRPMTERASELDSNRSESPTRPNCTSKKQEAAEKYDDKKKDEEKNGARKRRKGGTSVHESDRVSEGGGRREAGEKAY